MRTARGSDVTGLAGIPERRVLHDEELPRLEIVRPLLDVHPARLRAYLDVRGLSWREDPTNAAVDRDRVAIRARLVAAQARGAALDRRLAEAATRFRRASARHAGFVYERLAPSRRIRSGDRVYVHAGCATPVTIDALLKRAPSLENVELNHMTLGNAAYTAIMELARRELFA